MTSGTARPAPETVCQDAVEALRAQGYPLASVYLAVGDRLRCMAVGAYGQLFDGIPPGIGAIGRAYATATRVQVRPGPAAEEYRAAADGVAEELALPLLVRGTCVGVLNIECDRPIAAAEEAVLQEAAADLERALEAAGGPPPESAAQRLVRHATVLGEAEALPDMTSRLLSAAQDLSGFGSACLVLGRRVAAAVGPAAAELRELPPDSVDAVVQWVTAGGSSRTSGQPAAPSPVQSLLSEVGLRRFVLVPLHAQHELLAVLLVGDAEAQSVDRPTVEAMELLAALAAASLATLRSAAVLRTQARTDHLTGLPHRRAFEEALELALGTRQQGWVVAVLLIDLDGFKHVNDTHGHEAGDRVLTTAAHALAGALRTGDSLYRIGGDEFAVVLLVPDEREAARVADRLLLAAREAGMTVSIGGSLAAEGEGAADAVRTADVRLYEAKRTGRDRAVLSS